MSLPVRLLSAASLAVCVMLSPVSAQYVGPSSGSNAKSVADILKDPVDDQDVTVQGYLLRKQGDEKYIFSDGTGEIVAEIDDDDFPRGQPIDDKTRVELVGEVDTSRKRAPELDIERVRILK